MAEYHRKYFGLKKEVMPVLEETYSSKSIELLRAKGNRVSVGDLTVRIAKEFGFCIGVERAVQMAYETRRKYPDKRIFITAEIIHNPFVNQQLEEMGIIFLSGHNARGNLEDVTKDDIVILPAFGAAVELIEAIRSRGAFIVDSTCGAVISVWNNVHKYARDGFTSVIHGKFDHEETVATASRATGRADGFTGRDQAREGKYLIVRNMDEARYVCDYIVKGGDREAFLERFRRGVSKGFDPDRDLETVGVANQTTMLSGETLAIQGALQAAFVIKYGEDETRQRFRSIDTICSATQDRQSAVADLLAESTKPDAMIVVGGYNSSNTGHLAEMGMEHAVPTYHIDDAACISSKSRIRHQSVGQKTESVTEDWWPKKDEVYIAVTAGASTPSNKIGGALERLFELNGVSADSLVEKIGALPDSVAEED